MPTYDPPLRPERPRPSRPPLRLLRQPLQASPVGGRRRLRGDFAGGPVASVTVYPGVGPSVADPPLGALIRQGYAEGLRDGRRSR